MYEYLCGPTAFRLHRIPPQVLEFCPLLPDLDIRSNRYRLNLHQDQLASIGVPLHVLTTDAHHRRSTKAISPHQWTSELPSCAFMENDLGVTLASPGFTLLTMAPLVSDIHLLMAAYELCGAFSVYQPTPEVQQELDRTAPARPLISDATWRQVRNADGSPSSLWQRPPLMEVEELRDFIRKTKGMRGQRKLAWVAERVTGIVYSPFEAQASIKLGLSRRYGGEGLGPFTNNERIALTGDAQRLSSQTACYADIYFEETEAHGALDVECHGHMVHDAQAKGGLDANRTSALQSMGIDVVLLTHEQLTDPVRWEAAVNLIASKLGAKRLPKTDAMQEREVKLNSQLFIDWQTLGA